MIVAVNIGQTRFMNHAGGTTLYRLQDNNQQCTWNYVHVEMSPPSRYFRLADIWARTAGTSRSTTARQGGLQRPPAFNADAHRHQHHQMKREVYHIDNIDIYGRSTHPPACVRQQQKVRCRQCVRAVRACSAVQKAGKR